MKTGVLVMLAVALATVTAVAVPRLTKHGRPAAPGASVRSATLVAGAGNTLQLPHDVAQTLGVKTAPVQQAPPPGPLKLAGSLILDANSMVRVRPLFPGEIVEIGRLEDQASTPDAPRRTLQYGDRVRKGQVLAVIWSKEVGEKKSELVDALSKLHTDQEVLDRLQNAEKGAIAQRAIDDARRAYEADQVAVAKAKRTLLSWRLSDDEIEAAYGEAKRLRQREASVDVKTDKSWANTEVRSSIDGIILEKNFNTGDRVDPSEDLFKIADTSRVRVLAQVYEEDLSILRSLPPEKRRWKIDLRSDPLDEPISGEFQIIGSIIDQSMHTAGVMGTLDNSSGKLTVGQFITATIDRPPPKDTVAVPASAVVDHGAESLIFVQPDPKQPIFTCRKVVLMGHTDNGLVYLSTRPRSSGANLEDECPKPGDLVVTSGGLELAAALEELKAAANVAVARD
ncbi:MAG: efflux RND transporter periplasmic adaptor subunit [Planctomycetia bacterium]|nr:efflux RND transporter periplasmic adaptor subunit [Planctomycetia bacterium]